MPNDEHGSVVRQRRAAQYVRMSTDHQQYSTENQAQVIAEYAVRRGFDIVRTYADSGKSGLNLGGRAELQRLLADVRDRTADFSAILVYDVSRWGRFQDVDEAAAHEYACCSAGLSVHYCAEQFENDGSMQANVFKVMKRAMAGEYSRELSTKVYLGQCRLIGLGFRQGGPAGFGLRRLLLNEKGEPKGELARGEQKSIQTDRVVLVPGPDHEVEEVRRMYGAFIQGLASEADIATSLNERGIAAENGLWTRSKVREVLQNEKYVGHNVFNRVSYKLKVRRVVNPPEQWVRRDNAFEAVVGSDMFLAARLRFEERARKFSDPEMLELLRALLDRTGWLTGLLIDEIEELPSASAYQSRFGSLGRAYELIGYSPLRASAYVEVNRQLRAMHPGIVAEVLTHLESAGGTVKLDPLTELLTVNDEFTVSVVIARCTTTQGGSSRWKVRLDTRLRPDITVATRMDVGNEQVRDYFILPRLAIEGGRLVLAVENASTLETYRSDTLDVLASLAERTELRRFE